MQANYTKGNNSKYADLEGRVYISINFIKLIFNKQNIHEPNTRYWGRLINKYIKCIQRAREEEVNPHCHF